MKITIVRNIHVKTIIDTENWTVIDICPGKENTISDITVPKIKIKSIRDLIELIAELHKIPKCVVYFAKSSEILPKNTLITNHITVWLLYKPIKCGHHNKECC